MNDWNLEKSYKKIEQVIYQDDNEVDNETTNPDGNSDSEIIDENNEAEEPENEVPGAEAPEVEKPVEIPIKTIVNTSMGKNYRKNRHI